MATDGGKREKKLDETICDVTSPVSYLADEKFNGNETDHDDARVNEQTPDSAMVYIKNFKKGLNREGDRRSPK